VLRAKDYHGPSCRRAEVRRVRSEPPSPGQAAGGASGADAAELLTSPGVTRVTSRALAKTAHQYQAREHVFVAFMAEVARYIALRSTQGERLPPPSALHEREQVLVEPLLVRVGQAVWRASVNLVARVLDEFGRSSC
jgi:hypothetical protein